MITQAKLKEKKELLLNGLKFCNRCEIIKPIDNFYYCNSKRDKLSCFCKICCDKNVEKWENKHPNYHKEYSLIWRRDNKEKIKEKSKVWYINNKVDAIKNSSEYKRQRRKNDIGFRIRDLLANRIRTAIKNKSKKENKTTQLIGCSIEFFIKYIESKFLGGMNWNNYGRGVNRWNLEHILPCTLFNFRDKRQQFVCFNYINIQPMWHEDNMKKYDFLDDGRHASKLSPQEKLDYLKSKGHDFTQPV